MQLTDLAKPVRPSSEDYREGNYKPNLPDPFQSVSIYPRVSLGLTFASLSDCALHLQLFFTIFWFSSELVSSFRSFFIYFYLTLNN